MRPVLQSMRGAGHQEQTRLLLLRLPLHRVTATGMAVTVVTVVTWVTWAVWAVPAFVTAVLFHPQRCPLGFMKRPFGVRMLCPLPALKLRRRQPLQMRLLLSWSTGKPADRQQSVLQLGDAARRRGGESIPMVMPLVTGQTLALAMVLVMVMVLVLLVCLCMTRTS